MKKLLLLLMLASFGIAGTATAQKKSNKNCDNDKNKYSKKYDRKKDDRRNDDYDRRNVGYNNNAPRKVRDAFYRDYPNAKNVSWSKDRGVWTANFKNSGLFGGSRNVSYAANGRRLDNNNRIPDRRDNDNRTAKRSNNGTWDNIFNK